MKTVFRVKKEYVEALFIQFIMEINFKNLPLNDFSQIF